MKPAPVSQHLEVLKDAGLIRGDVDGPRVCYFIEPRTLRRLESVEAIDPAAVDTVVTLCAEEVCPAFLGRARRLALPQRPRHHPRLARAARGGGAAARVKISCVLRARCPSSEARGGHPP